MWEYIEPFLKKKKVDTTGRILIKTKLAHIYTLATAEVLGINIESDKYSSNITQNSKFDPQLFALCLNQLGILFTIYSLDNNQLMRLKNKIEFIAFKELYFKLIDKFSANNICKSLEYLSKVENIYSLEFNKNEFIKKFCKQSNLKLKTYKDPIEHIIKAISNDHCPIYCIRDLKKVTNELNDNNSSKNSNLIIEDNLTLNSNKNQKIDKKIEKGTIINKNSFWKKYRSYIYTTVLLIIASILKYFELFDSMKSILKYIFYIITSFSGLWAFGNFILNLWSKLHKKN